MYKYFILLVICVILTGCESGKKENNTASGKDVKDTVINSNPIIQKKINGMFEYKDSIGLITDCENGNTYNLAEDINLKSIDSVYNSFDIKNPKRKLFVVAVGFNSVKENTKSNIFDTVIVITKLIALDTAFNCQK
jgi:hypothetical protein